jgi:hypothetical protein
MAVPIAAVMTIGTAVVMAIVMAIPLAIVVAPMTIAVAMVSLRRGHHAGDERERQSRSSNEPFHFDLPTHPGRTGLGRTIGRQA